MLSFNGELSTQCGSVVILEMTVSNNIMGEDEPSDIQTVTAEREREERVSIKLLCKERERAS